MMRDHSSRMKSAREILEGLSVGDSIGQALSYGWYRAREKSDFAAMRDGTLPYTDDTEMAIGIVQSLERSRTIEEDLLAWEFGERFTRQPDRGYGKMARHILREIAAGANWREVSSAAFGGGSFGNGAAMRVAPLGAYFADEPGAVPEMAARSARITHFHPEGIAGAIAVALASAEALNRRGTDPVTAAHSIWEAVLTRTPTSRLKGLLEYARPLSEHTATEVAREVGNGAEITAQDTVPFCIWNACRNINDYPEAVISTIEVGGDCDTNCAIVGGIVSAFVGTQGIPEDWRRVREPLR